MRTSLAVLAAPFIVSAVACYVGSGPSSGAQVAAGKTLVDSLACSSCHGADLSGSDTPLGVAGSLAYPANLTPDPATGIGAWSDDDVVRAMRTGVDDEGAALCSAMPRFDAIDDAQAASIVAYLRSVAAVAHEVPASHCAPPADLDDGGVDDAGVVIVTDDAPSCDGFAGPATQADCHACAGAECQPNGCYGGWYCELASLRCVEKPPGC